MRSRWHHFNASTWLDGGIAATTSAALIAALVFEPIVAVATEGGPAAVLTNMAYPVGDRACRCTAAFIMSARLV